MRKPSITDRHAVAWMLLVTLVLVAPSLLTGCREKAEPPETPPAEKPAETPAEKPPEEPPPATTTDTDKGWESLFDGKTLKHWKSTEFGGEGKVVVEDGQITLNMGTGDMTGITWAGQRDDLPHIDYEISLRAMRVEGDDFFCGLTFPYKDSHATLICGGWGGGLVGISSLDHMDASENETSTYYEFKSGQWYDILLRVRDNSIRAWIDGKQVIDAQPGKRKVDVRIEVEDSIPLGIAMWHTKAALKDLQLRRLLDE